MNQLFRGEGFTPFLPSPLPSPVVLQLYSLFVFHTRCARECRARLAMLRGEGRGEGKKGIKSSPLNLLFSIVCEGR